MRRNHTKLRYEGLGLAASPSVTAPATSGSAAVAGSVVAADYADLFEYRCGENGSDITLGPARWVPTEGGPCSLVSSEVPPRPALIALKRRAGPSAADLVALELWYKASPSDHYAVSSAAGRADAAAAGWPNGLATGVVAGAAPPRPLLPCR